MWSRLNSIRVRGGCKEWGVVSTEGVAESDCLAALHPRWGCEEFTTKKNAGKGCEGCEIQGGRKKKTP